LVFARASQKSNYAKSAKGNKIRQLIQEITDKRDKRAAESCHASACCWRVGFSIRVKSVLPFGKSLCVDAWSVNGKHDVILKTGGTLARQDRAQARAQKIQ